MPLIILGLIVVIGIVLYALVQYGNSGDEDTRTVRERYPHAFPPKNDVKDIFDSFMKADDEGAGSEDAKSESNIRTDGNKMYFPDNAELEKRKRNIH